MHLKLLNLYPGEVNLSFSSNQILISSDEFRFVSKLIEGNYPDYQKVFPSGEEQTLKVEKSLIQTALNRASVLSNEKYKELGANAFEFSKGFSWSKIIKNYINLI